RVRPALATALSGCIKKPSVPITLSKSEWSTGSSVSQSIEPPVPPWLPPNEPPVPPWSLSVLLAYAVQTLDRHNKSARVKHSIFSNNHLQAIKKETA
ncbi:hypothetical protein LIQ16_18675, partial [Blautia schinkii]|uniref:hypothetical protein n=1 Tax=Blautia TaxID=572511 RepID=UPI001A9AC68A